jgi:hypothetical protein
MKLSNKLMQNWQLGHHLFFKNCKDYYVVGKDYNEIRLAKFVREGKGVLVLINSYKLEDIELNKEKDTIIGAIPQKLHSLLTPEQFSDKMNGEGITNSYLITINYLKNMNKN